MIAIISNTYPEKNKLYENAFVHRRATLYKERGINVIVICPNHKCSSYIFDGVEVHKGTTDYISNIMKNTELEAIFIHFLTTEVYEIAECLTEKNNITKYVWIHGFEAESWHRRHFIFSENAKELLKTVNKKEKFNDYQLNLFKSIFSSRRNDYRFIHVSRWFKDNVVECDIGFTTPNNTIIPNPIDTTIFKFQTKSTEQRHKILIIRPFTSSKYANDISIKTIEILSKKAHFSKMEFLICGDGDHFETLTKPLRKFKNVTLKKGFLTQESISKLHKEYGIFLCPTRWDSQGVSMCEAMSSGMVVVASNVAAVPEFVSNNISGVLSENTPEEFADKILYLVDNPKVFDMISKNSSNMINEICGSDKIIKKEINLINCIPEATEPQEYHTEKWKEKYYNLEDTFFKSISGICDSKVQSEIAKIYIKGEIENILGIKMARRIIQKSKALVKSILKNTKNKAHT